MGNVTSVVRTGAGAVYGLDAIMRPVDGASSQMVAVEAAKLRATKLYMGLAIQVPGRRLVQVGLFDRAPEIEKKLRDAARGERKREKPRSKKRKKVR